MEEEKPVLNFPESIPVPITLEILSFLPIEQIRNVKLISKTFHEILANPENLHILLDKFYNLHYLTSMNTTDAEKQLIKKNFSKISQIPFWGYSTNGGIYQNNLKNWIGKAFFMTASPNVRLKKSKGAKIVGALAQNYVDFTTSLIQISKLIWQGDDQKQKLNLKVQEIKIFPTFLMLFHTHNLPKASALVNQQWTFHSLRLRNYSQTMGALLHTRAAIDQYNINIQYQPLQKISNIHQVIISRGMKSKNPVQSILISYKKFDITSEGLEQLFFNNNGKYLKSNVKYSNFELDNVTNMNQLDAQNSYKYIIFKQNEQGILLWVNLFDKKKVRISLPSQSRVWTKNIQLHLLRGKSEFEDFTNQSQLSFHYCSFRGVTIDYEEPLQLMEKIEKV